MKITFPKKTGDLWQEIYKLKKEEHGFLLMYQGNSWNDFETWVCHNLEMQKYERNWSTHPYES